MKQVGVSLVADESGSGAVDFSDEFLAEEAIYRADLLEQWMNALDVAYAEAVHEMEDLMRDARTRRHRRRKVNAATGSNVIHLKEWRCL